MSSRGVLIRIDSTDSLCDQAEMISPKSPNILKSEYFDTVRPRGECSKSCELQQLKVRI